MAGMAVGCCRTGYRRLRGGWSGLRPPRNDAFALVVHALRRVPSHSDSSCGEGLGPGQTFFSSGSSSSEIIRMLWRAVPSGMPAQWVRKVRWFTPNSSQ